jgi:hypothetical protein
MQVFVAFVNKDIEWLLQSASFCTYLPGKVTGVKKVQEHFLPSASQAGGSPQPHHFPR